MHYIDWSQSFNRETNIGVVWRPVTQVVEKHYNIVLLGESKTQPLKTEAGEGSPIGKSRITGEMLYTHFCQYLDNVPESDKKRRITEAKTMLAVMHNVTPDTIEVKYY